MAMTEEDSWTLVWILGRLQDKFSITQAELEDLHDYIFGRILFPPSFVDRELYESVVYLEEIASDEQFKNLNDILKYWERKSRKLRWWFNLYIDQNPPDEEVE